MRKALVCCEGMSSSSQENALTDRVCDIVEQSGVKSVTVHPVPFQSSRKMKKEFFRRLHIEEERGTPDITVIGKSWGAVRMLRYLRSAEVKIDRVITIDPVDAARISVITRAFTGGHLKIGEEYAGAAINLYQRSFPPTGMIVKHAVNLCVPDTNHSRILQGKEVRDVILGVLLKSRGEWYEDALAKWKRNLAK